MHVYSHKRNTSCKTSKNGFFIHTCIIYVGNWHCCGNWGGRDRTRSLRNCFFVLLIHASILLYLVKYLPQEKNKTQKPTHQKSILSLKHGCTNKRLILLSLTVGFSSMFTYGYNFAAPLYSQYSLGNDPKWDWILEHNEYRRNALKCSNRVKSNTKVRML